MFAAPPELPTQVFTTLPEELKIKEPSDWTRVKQGGKPTYSFLEGPSFDREGNLYCVDIPHGRVFRITPAGVWSVVARYDGEPNGLKIRKDGEIFIADHRHGLMHLDPVNGRITPYCTRYNFEQFKGINDLVFARNGDIYFTDQGSTGLHDPSGRLFRLRPSGQVDLVLAGIPSPNGLVLTRDEHMILLAVTRGNAVWRVPLHPDSGVAFKVGVFIQLSGSSVGGPDGMALDEQGNLSIAIPGLGTVWQFNEEGEPLFRMRTCVGRKPTNLAYGGPEGKSLFITEAETGSILRAELPVRGQTMYSHT